MQDKHSTEYEILGGLLGWVFGLPVVLGVLGVVVGLLVSATSVAASIATSLYISGLHVAQSISSAQEWTNAGGLVSAHILIGFLLGMVAGLRMQKPRRDINVDAI